jgi:vacuolar-type H+-ATPase subunit I/STV1
MSNSQTKVNVDSIDYLTEDPVINDQRFMCVSFLTSKSVEEKYRDKDLSVCGVKVRGCYATYEEAKSRAEFLRKCDQYHNIYVAEVGKWCPFEDNPEKAKDSDYMNKELNNLMKSYWKQQTDAKEFHEVRKQDMMKKALDEVTKKKQQNESEDSGSGDSLLKKKKKTITKLNNKLNDLKSDLDTDKEELDKEKKEIDENINTLRRLEDELAAKLKEMEGPGSEVKSK